MRATLGGLGRQPWIWSAIAAVAAWVATLVISGGQGGGQVLTAALSFSAFTILVSLGQMFVITTGPGNVDLSIPSAIALSGAVAMLVMDQRDAMIVPGLLAATAAGVLVGLFNYALIRLLRIPPIIATLSSSLIVMSCAIALGRGLKVKPPQAFSDFSTLRLAGVPVLALLALAVSLVLAVVLERTVYGRSVSALGQSRRIAHLAGLRVEVTRCATYVLCAALAGFTGALIAGFAGGNSLDQGEEYLLLSIAVVVIGGTSVAGGRASVAGVWGASLLMFLIVTMLNAAGTAPGLRTLLTGLIIIAVIAIAGGETVRR